MTQLTATSSCSHAESLQSAAVLQGRSFTRVMASAHFDETAPIDVGGTSGRGPSGEGGSGGGSTGSGREVGAGGGGGSGMAEAGAEAEAGAKAEPEAEAGADGGDGVGGGAGDAPAQAVRSTKIVGECRIRLSMFAPPGPRGKGNPPL